MCRTAVVLGCWFIALGNMAAAAEPQPERIAELVKQLDAEDFNEREAATKELQAIGEPAQAAVGAAAKDSKSAEVRLRAGRVLKEIQREIGRRNPLKIADIIA